MTTFRDALAQGVAPEEGQTWDEFVEAMAHPSMYPGLDPIDIVREWYATPREMADAIIAALPEEWRDPVTKASWEHAADLLVYANRALHAAREDAKRLAEAGKKLASVVDALRPPVSDTADRVQDAWDAALRLHEEATK